jgi:gamma-glutamylcyclotransferase (GGCT)/AIG2-like uncharacterized protein YtfP
MTLFVYGTLFPALAPSSIAAAVARLRSLGPATVPGRLYDLGPYPGLVADDESRVVGELFAVPDGKLLAALDEYEGREFRRVSTMATMPSGDAVACWLYVYAGDVGRAAVIAGGDYRRWVGIMETGHGHRS